MANEGIKVLDTVRDVKKFMAPRHDERQNVVGEFSVPNFLVDEYTKRYLEKPTALDKACMSAVITGLAIKIESILKTPYGTGMSAKDIRSMLLDALKEYRESKGNSWVSTELKFRVAFLFAGTIIVFSSEDAIPVDFKYNGVIGADAPKGLLAIDPYTRKFAYHIPTGSVLYAGGKPDYRISCFIKDSGILGGTVDETYFRGLKGTITKYASAYDSYKQLEEEKKKLEEKAKVFQQEFKGLSPLIKEKVSGNAEKILGFSAPKFLDLLSDEVGVFLKSKASQFRGADVDYFSDRFELVLDEVRYPQEGAFGGSVYREYDGNMFTYEDREEAYVKGKYPSLISTISSYVSTVNKKLGYKFLDFGYGIGLSDKTGYVYFSVHIPNQSKLATVSSKVLSNAYALLKKGK